MASRSGEGHDIDALIARYRPEASIGRRREQDDATDVPDSILGGK